MCLHSLFNIIFQIFAFLCLFWTIYVDADYKIKLISLKKCPVEAAGVAYQVSARKVDRDTTLVRTNFTIPARTGPFTITFRTYQVESGSPRGLVLQLERLPCGSPIAYQLVRSLRVNLTRDCFAMPGTYYADKINIEDFKWLLTKAMIGAGKYSYDLQFLSDRRVVACIDISVDIVNLK